MATRPTWNTKVLDSISRMMIRFSRMPVSWILRGKRVCVEYLCIIIREGCWVLLQALTYMKSTS